MKTLITFLWGVPGPENKLRHLLPTLPLVCCLWCIPAQAAETLAEMVAAANDEALAAGRDMCIWHGPGHRAKNTYPLAEDIELIQSWLAPIQLVSLEQTTMPTGNLCTVLLPPVNRPMRVNPLLRAY